MVSSRSVLLWLSMMALALSSIGQAQGPTPAASPLALDQMHWRHIGPASFGGRIDDVEAVASNPSIIFVGTASGGVFKTVNNGVTWSPVFDRDGTALSIGDIAIAPSDPNIIWVGTGEANGRQSSSWGDGIYKSVDGGESWKHMGLRDTQHIGRVVVHPKNPDIVYVAAMGHLWGPNPERGLFRTENGGKTWQNVLKGDDDTGVGEVAIDQDGRTLFAATYQRRRRGFGFVGGGPGSAIYRSFDGGDTWEKLSKGLPAGTLGRVGIEISRSNPNIVYALVEHKTAGGTYRSDDRGTTWTHQGSFNPRPSYYSQLRIDPKNPDKIWVLGSFGVSIDAGKTFRSEHTTDLIHTDHHALWIDPNNPDHLLLGNDGGLYFSYDGSKNWEFVDNLPIGQYYDVDIDTRDPYWIYGGTQDNGTWGIPSRTSGLGGITNKDVVNIAYGDGFYVAVDPRDYRTIYANSQSGRTYLVDLETREEQGLRPVPTDPKETYQFNWSTPMLMSPSNPDVVYYGGNKLFKTTDRGHTWTPISPDLTRGQEWKKLPLMGPERGDETLSRDDGVSDFGTITTISESPKQAGLLYVGTDDGNVQMTRDGGKTWHDLSEKFRQKPHWVSRVVASMHDAGTAYVTFDGHQDDDFKPYIYRSSDNGATFTSIAGDMPDGMSVHVIAEHPRNRNLLLAGTEFGLFVTVNGGRNWTLVRGNLPRVRIDDILITPTNDIVLGTHGRSIIILDDASLLEHSDEKVMTEDAHLFPPRPATQYYQMRNLPTPGAFKYSGPNPDYGALITYYLKGAPAKADSQVTIQILDPSGKMVRELKGPDRAGYNRVPWDLRYPLTYEPGSQDEGWFGAPKGTFVLPGDYRVKLMARGKEMTETVQVRIDPKSRTTPEALKARFESSQRVADLARSFVEGSKTVEALDKQMTAVKAAVKDRSNVPQSLTARIDEFGKQVDTLKSQFRAGFNGPKFRYLDLFGAMQASTSTPTQAQLTTIQQLSADLTKNLTTLNNVIAKDWPQLESELKANNISAGMLQPVTMPKSQ